MLVIFTKDYWISQIKEFKSVKKIVMLGVMLAFLLVFGGISTYFPLKIFNREISFTFILWPIIGCLFGPLPASILGFISDVLSYFIFPTGYAFYVGYSFSLALTGFLSGIFFYKVNIGVIKSLVYRSLVNFGIHVLIESLFMKDIMKWGMDAYLTYMSAGAIKNLIFLPFEVIIIVGVMAAMLRVFKQTHLIDEEISPNIKIL